MILSKTSPKEKYEVSGSNIILHEKDLILSETLDCGQAFRWYKVAENTYSGYYLDTPLEISGSDGVFTLKNTTEAEFFKHLVRLFRPRNRLFRAEIQIFRRPHPSECL